MENDQTTLAGPVHAPSRRRAIRIVTRCVTASVLALVSAAAGWHWFTQTRGVTDSGREPHGARSLFRPLAIPSGAVAFIDPWGTPLEYLYPGVINKGGYDLVSWGPDRMRGTDDDIANYTLSDR